MTFLCWNLLLSSRGGQMDIISHCLQDGTCLYLGVDDCKQDVGTTVRMTCVAHVLLLLIACSEFGIHLSSLNKLNASDGSFKLPRYISASPSHCM